MQNTMLGLIFADNPEASMGELTSCRSLAAVPVGGRYRIIDFILSNMVNSGVINVGITTPHNYQSLTDHLGTGKDWDMDRKDNGLFILPPKDTGESPDVPLGGLDIINGVSSYLSKCRQDYVLVADCNTICNISMKDVMRTHIESEADITMIYTSSPKLSPKQLKKHILIDVNESGRVTDVQVYPSRQKTDFSYMHMFLIKRELLIELVEDAVAHGKHTISKDLFLPKVNELYIHGYNYTGYSKKIDSIKSYFEFNLELLHKEVRDELFGKVTDNRIYTKIKDMVPTKYGKGAEVSNSFIADGCVIEGTVKNSILFRGVHVGKGSVIENCIIMQDSEVMENCMLENVIFDKEVVLRGGKKLVGQETYPMVIGKQTVV